MDIHTNNIERPLGFYNNLRNYFNTEAASYFSEQINHQKLRIDSDDFSYRIINHWEKNGLLLNIRPDGKGWRRYSVIDLLWINIIGSLRKFGFSIESLKSLRSFIGQQIDGEDFNTLDLLTYYTGKVLSQKLQTFVLVFSNGTMDIMNNSEYQEATSEVGINNHIKINLNNILKKIFEDVNLEPVLEEMMELTPNEIYLLANARTGNYEYINIQITEHSGLTYSPDDIKKNFIELIDIINNEKFRSISIKVQGKDLISI